MKTMKLKPGKSLVKTASLLILASSLLLSACGGGSGGTASGSGGGKDGGEPTSITIQTLNYATEFIDNTNPLWKELEKRTNTKLNITWLSPSTAEEKINVMLASGDLPEVTFVESMQNPQLQKMLKQGVFWDLTPFLKDYPNLNREELKEMWEITKVDGKNMVIPRYYPSYGGGVFPMIRKDWLDALGLETPKTLDEFYNVLKAFKEKDPNGNGQADEIPYAANPGALAYIYNIFNETQGGWKLEPDNTLSPIITSDASREAMLWIKKAYDDGLFPKDFAIMKFSQVMDTMRSAKAGVGGMSMNHAWVTGQPVKEVDPKADLMPLAYLENANGVKYTPLGSPYYGVYLIPKKVPEAKVKKILEFFDYGYSVEGNEMLTYGLEGVHYKVENGKKVATPQAAIDKTGDGNLNNMIHLVSDDMAISAVGMPDEVYQRNVEIVTERKTVKVPNPSAELYSEAYNKYYPEISKKVEDMRVMVITGKEPIEAYDQLIETIKNDPKMAEITEEMTKAYQEKYLK
ncbi:extracellular solute-binding protein [Paenibacillus lactis]|uniref:extracellular solute-binding protein n=1 Tax=Paenibacillus lactis TaxID=228574 RepID=UPI001B1961D2|nr:extracellular solute-binding protein [Paenibacillus lactis]GIO89001.1 putative ABC transporter peptide-binding protein YtcQ [Paenibacillus lactis]